MMSLSFVCLFDGFVLLHEIVVRFAHELYYALNWTDIVGCDLIYTIIWGKYTPS